MKIWYCLKTQNNLWYKLTISQKLILKIKNEINFINYLAFYINNCQNFYTALLFINF